jgi:hypothetical protein
MKLNAMKFSQHQSIALFLYACHRYQAAAAAIYTQSNEL